MANRLYELGTEPWLFDDEAEVDDEDAEGARLSLFIALALVGTVIFTGVIWLAYTQGKSRPRGETPATMVAHALRPPLAAGNTISIVSSIESGNVANDAQRTLPGKLGPKLSPVANLKEGFRLQIGAFKSESEARLAWLAYKTRHATVLAGYGSEVQLADLGRKGAWYRLRVAGFPNRDRASELCKQLRADGSGCFLTR